jgi:pyruvate/2-oxoglutarate dehydrogenase complex dihydrolipoamide dehydrogenase (E3) component
VFTPLEYGCCGLAEEDAEKQLGADKIEVYHTAYKPLELTVPARGDNAGYVKVIVDKATDKVRPARRPPAATAWASRRCR